MPLPFDHSPNPSFTEAFCRHRGNIADKWEGYLAVYDEILQRKRSECANFLEIGVNNGGSLEVFAEYFRRAKTITGVDINPLCELIPFQDQRIHVIIGDSNSSEVNQRLVERAESYDLILDDGSHHSSDIIHTFVNLAGLVSPGGTYIVEDLCCSYWQEFGGGVNSHVSAMGFLKKLVDIVNFEHWNSAYSLADYLGDSGVANVPTDSLQRLSTIRSISFYNSICVIDFATISSEGAIGKRICRGSQALAGYIPVNGQGIKEVGADQSNNPLNTRQSPSP
jgi:23S rRNA U2552 (ribose-2'-O)-methylase RlmE/FtsJ